MPRERLGLQRFRDTDEPAKQAQVWIQASRTAARQGDVDEARHLLRAAVQTDPACTEAWLKLAWLATDPREQAVLLRRVLEIEPDHAQARAALAHLQPSPAPPARRPGTSHKWLSRGALVLLTLAAAILLVMLLAWGPVDHSLAWLLSTPAPTPLPTPTLTPAQVAARFVPRLEAALADGNWERALEIVAIMGGVDPSGEEVQRWKLATHLRYGQALVQDGRVEEAIRQFDQAVAVAPQDAEALLWQHTSQLYSLGQEAFARGDFGTAIQAFSQAHDQMPGYGDLFDRLLEAYCQEGQMAIEDGDWSLAIDALTEALALVPDDPHLGELLSAAHRERGIARQAQGEYSGAKTDLEAALALRPDDTEARTHLDEVLYALFPPKKIEVDISEQWLYAWEGDNLIFSFVTSTGLPGRDTATGHYRVLDKIPMAYSSVWNLKMPLWLGIYYVGNIENGIHALPIRSDGSVMWGGLLGQRASYGCIILSNEAAQLLYDWAEIGTAVDIHY